MIEVTGTNATVKVPTTPSEWELYCGKDGVEKAAGRMTRAIVKALTAPTRDEAIKIARKAMELDAKFGACDTEPRVIAEHLLSKGRGGDFSWSL